MGNGVLSKPLKGQPQSSEPASQAAPPKAASSAPAAGPNFTFLGARITTDEPAKDGDLNSFKIDRDFGDLVGLTKREVVAAFREVPEASDRRIQQPAAELSSSRDTAADEKEKWFRTSLYEDLSPQGTAIWPGVGDSVAAVPADAAADPRVGLTDPARQPLPLPLVPLDDSALWRHLQQQQQSAADQQSKQFDEPHGLSHQPHAAFYQVLKTAPARGEPMFQTSEAGTSAGGDSCGGEEAEKHQRAPSMFYIAKRGGGSGTALSSGPGGGVDAAWSISSDAGSAGANLDSLDLYSASAYGCSGYGYGAAGGGAASGSGGCTAGGSELIGTFGEEEADLEGVLGTAGPRHGDGSVAAGPESPPASLVTPFNIPDQLRLAEQHYERLQRGRKGATAAAAAGDSDGGGRGYEAATLLDPPTEEISPAQLAALKPQFPAATAVAAAVAVTSMADAATTQEQLDHIGEVVRQLSSSFTTTAQDGAADVLGGRGGLNSADIGPSSGEVVREPHKAQEEDQPAFDALVRDGSGGTAIASATSNPLQQQQYHHDQTVSTEASEVVGSGASAVFASGGWSGFGGVDAGDAGGGVRAPVDLTHRHPSLEDVVESFLSIRGERLFMAALGIT
ncbi:hypothetical protein Vafri_10544 [Volvox africanus]|uniref:Uncharacterized protein n=1 Tax=Volvox africanus TaxID=51714 RepID=A0A8J4F0T0_9CHLO|nr:hypothetical protein Vafri_10544 [Volvox africanus]